MRFHVIVNGKDLGSTEHWQAPTELVNAALEKGIINDEDLKGPQVIEQLSTVSQVPTQANPVPGRE